MVVFGGAVKYARISQVSKFPDSDDRVFIFSKIRSKFSVKSVHVYWRECCAHRRMSKKIIRASQDNLYAQLENF